MTRSHSHFLGRSTTRGLAFALLVGLGSAASSCDALWGGLTRENPQHCGSNPSACTEFEVCNAATALCEPRPLGLLPGSLVRGPASGGTQVTLRGSGFASDVQVTFDGAAATQIRVDSAEQLTVTSPPNPHGRWRVPLVLSRAASPATMATRDDLFAYYSTEVKVSAFRATGLNVPGQLAIVDLSGDGLSDVALLQPFTSSAVILRGQADGTLGMPSLLGTSPTQPLDLAIGDVNSDQRPDVVIGGMFGVEVLQNENALPFRERPIDATAVTALALGDVTGDGILDIVTGSATQIALLRGNGQGGFQAPTAIDTGGQIVQISIVDLNKDGLKDIAIAYKGGGMRLLQSRAGQSFSAFPLPDLTGRNCTPMSLGFFEGEPGAKTPIAVGCATGGLLFRAGAAGDYEVGPAFAQNIVLASQININDFNGDTYLDIAMVDATKHTLLFALGDGKGGLAPATTAATIDAMLGGGNSLTMASGDIGGDGKPDLVIAQPGAGGEVMLHHNASP